MAEKTPVRVNYDGSNNPIGFAEFQADDFIGLDDGGTGGSYASLAELLSGVGLGTGDTPTFTGLITSGNVTIGGNLTVDGTTTTVNSTTVTIDDPIFTLGGDAELAADDNKDRGIEFRWHDGTGSKLGFFGFDDSTGKFTFIPDAINAAETFSGTAGTIVANLEGNVTGTISSISNFDTDDLTEGATNLYFTNERVDDRVAALLIDSTTSGIDISYDDVSNSLTISTDLSEIIESLQDNVEGLFVGGTGVSATYNDASNQLELAIDFSEFDTGSITEGSNLFFTDERVDDRISALLVDANTEGIDVSYDDAGNQLTLSVDLTEIVESLQDNVQGLFSGGTGITATYDDAANTLALSIDFTEFDTDDLVEGTTNLFYTEGRFDTSFAGKSTTDLTEGTNLYYTTARANTDFDTKLAAADTDDLSEGSTNIYYTDTRANSAIDTRVDKAFIDALNVDADTLDGIDSTGFATSAQGTLADSALQSGDNITELTNNANYIDLTDISVTDSGGDGSLSYDNTTGVITYTGPSQAEVLAHISGGTGITVSGAGVIATTITQYADSDVEAYLSGGTGVSFSSGVISIGQAVGTTDNVTFNNVTVDGVLNSDDITATTMTVSNDLVVTGDLTVQGTTTTLNTDTVSTEENMIKLASGNTGNSTDIGIYGKVVQSSTTKYVGLHWDPGVGQNKFKLFDSLTVEPTGTVDTADASYTKATLVANIEGDITGALTGNADTATSLASAQNFSLTGDVTATAISFDGTGAVALSTTVTESAVTQHEAALTITESQISDLQSYLTVETNDLTAAVTWANVPDANITQSSVTQHQAALAINESQITFTSNFLENLVEDLTPQLGGTLDANGNTIDMGVNVITDTKVGQWDTAYSWGDHASAGYLTSYTETDPIYTASSWYTTTNNSTNWDTAYGWGDHSAAGYLTSFTETNDLTAAVTWANVPDANITQTSVTQHEAALSITESQITDLGTYLENINSLSIDELSDVDTSSVAPTNGQALVWDSVNSVWEPGNISSTLSALTDTTISSPSNGEALVYNSSTGQWENSAVGVGNMSSFTISDGSNTSTIIDSDTLTFNGTTNEVEVLVSGDSLTIGLPSDVTIGNDLTVTGNLTVSGTTTTVNTETINLADNTILLNSNETGTPSQNGGIEIERGTSTNVSFLWDEANDRWTVGAYDLVAQTFIGNLTGNVTGDVTGDIDGAIILSGKNETGSTIGAGVPVYISGQSGSGTEFTVAPADADGSGTMPAIGITTASATNNSAVSILTFGKFVGLDTSSFSVGDELYVSTTGILTNTAPTGETASLQKIAKVTRSHATDGAIFVQGAGRSNAVPNLDDGDIFIGNASNQAVTASFNTTFDTQLATKTTDNLTEGSTNLYYSSSLFDTDFSGKTTTDLTEGTNLYYTDARADARIAAASIGDLSDVDITTAAPTDGQALVWNAANSEFEPGTVASSTNYFQTIAVSGQSDVVPDSTTDTLNFAAGANITLTTDASTDTITIAATGGAANAFSTLAVSGQSNVVADSETDTLTLAAGTGMTITTDASTDTITFTSSGGGGGSLPVILAGSTSDPITLSDITVAGAIPFTSFDGTTDNIQLGSTQQAVTAFADNDADTSIEVERTTDNDTVYIKAGGTDVLTATSSGVTITNLTVTGNSVQANELKVTDTLFELNADGTELTTDAGMIVERGSTGDNAAFVWDESEDAWVAGTTATDGSASSSLTLTEASLKAATQTQGDNSTNVATTAYVDTAVGSLSSNSITDADNDTKIQVEESSDEDIIRVDTDGQERLTIDNNVSMSARGGFFTHQLTMDSNETFTIASTEGTVAAGPLDIQGTVDVQGSLVVL